MCKGFFRNDQEAVHRAVADGGSAAVGIEIIRGFAHADNRIFIVGEHIADFFVGAGFQLHRITDLIAGSVQKLLIGDTFVIAFRVAPFEHFHLVNLIGQRQNFCDDHCVFGLAKIVFCENPLCARNTVQSQQRRHVIIGHAEGAEHADIHHIFFVKGRVRGSLHRGACRADTGKESHTERRNQKNRQKPADTFADFAPEVFSHTFCHACSSFTTQCTPRGWGVCSSKSGRFFRF